MRLVLRREERAVSLSFAVDTPSAEVVKIPIDKSARTSILLDLTDTTLDSLYMDTSLNQKTPKKELGQEKGLKRNYSLIQGGQASNGREN